jgi:hypothetical protein
MKKLIIILLLIPVFCNAQIKQDKYYHSIAGIGISTGVHFSQGLFYREMNPIAPSLITMSAATFKEGYDVMNGGNYSWSDWAFTTISGIATNAVLRAIYKPKPKKLKDPYNETFNPELIKIYK